MLFRSWYGGLETLLPVASEAPVLAGSDAAACAARFPRSAPCGCDVPAGEPIPMCDRLLESGACGDARDDDDESDQQEQFGD